MQNIESLTYGNYYHIYNRGINSCNLFLEADNYEHFVGLYDKYISPVASGFMIRGDVKDLAVIHMANGEKRILAAVNNDEMRMFRINQ